MTNYLDIHVILSSHFYLWCGGPRDLFNILQYMA